MSCIIVNGTVETIVSECPENFVPIANKAVMALTTRTTIYIQSLLVLFNGCIACGRYENHKKNNISIEHKNKEKYKLRRMTNMDAFNVLIASNFAMIAVAFVLAFAPKHTLDFHNGIVVIYLTCLIWFSVVAAAPFYIRLKISVQDTVLQVVVYMQSILFFAYIYALLANAHTFGPSFCCNSTAQAIIFGVFRALSSGGQTAGWAITSLLLGAYVLYEMFWFSELWIKNDRALSPELRSSRTRSPRPSIESRTSTIVAHVAATNDTDSRHEARSGSESEGQENDTNIDLDGVMKTANMRLFILYFIVWLFVVVNTEILIDRSGFLYDIKDKLKFSIMNPVDFAQTLKFSDVITFFVPFVHLIDTIRKLHATGRRVLGVLHQETNKEVAKEARNNDENNLSETRSQIADSGIAQSETEGSVTSAH